MACLTAGAGVHRVWVGWTPLHVAAARGEDDVATLLLASGADVNARGGESRLVPLHNAALGGHLELVRALVEAGAHTTRRGDTWRAVRNGFGPRAITCRDRSSHAPVRVLGYCRPRPRPPGAGAAAGLASATISTASPTRTATAMYCRPAFV
jgi:ankyrin repeat protein